jgi:membrane protein YqaA with SNARE-associated domain
MTPPLDRPHSPPSAAGLGRLARGRWGQVGLFWASFLDGALLPLPMEAVLAPYMLARRDIVWWLATLGVAGFLAAALVGYALGALVFADVVEPFAVARGWGPQLREVEAFMAAHGFWALILVNFTPAPAQLGMVVAGATGYPLVGFVLAMGAARGVRYYALAVLVLVCGDRVLAWLERRRAGRRWWRGRAQPPR